jgi:hypothetical protein
MSLFENAAYQWRETYLVLFESIDRPTADRVKMALEELGSQYEIYDVRSDEDGRFDSLTLVSPDDYAAMDVSYVSGEEVTEQTKELVKELKQTTATEAEIDGLKRILGLDARFDIYHFEEIVTGDEEDDEFMDPGCLLQVIDELTRLVHGVGLDPASGAFL